MKNTRINRVIIRKVATALGELNNRVVFVGGAAVSLYVNDPAADDVRPTQDVDISLEITSLTDLEKFREAIVERGFTQSHEDQVVCRFRYEDVIVDVMSTQSVGWASSNRWFQPGFKYLETTDIDGISINILSFPYFLATKFEAYYNRGRSDPLTSKDYEDIVYLIDFVENIPDLVRNSPLDVKDFLLKWFDKIRSDDRLQEAILAQLYYETQEERFEMIMDKLHATVS